MVAVPYLRKRDDCGMSVILGVNHMFLYPESMTDEKVHTETLKEIIKTDLVDALDLWVWRGKERSKEEFAIIRDCGKWINYNIGDRFGEEPVFPSSKYEKDRTYAYDIFMREIEYAVTCGAKKLVFGSGPDDVKDHNGALERYFEFLIKLSSQIPKDMKICLEPTDWDIDKHFLCGPLLESVELAKIMRKEGYENFGLLLDMSHIPIMHESLESAVEKCRDVLTHIHMGNAVIKNKQSPFYGDKHIPWSYPDSEYTEKDGVTFIKLLKEIGYTKQENATASFEMRPYENMGAMQTLEKFVSVWQSAQ